MKRKRVDHRDEILENLSQLGNGIKFTTWDVLVDKLRIMSLLIKRTQVWDQIGRQRYLK